jgi:hypothetical protein
VWGLLPAGRPAPGRAPPRAIDCFLRLILFKAPAAHAARFALGGPGASKRLDTVVLQPLAVASGPVLDLVAEGAKRMIDEWAQRSPPDRRAGVANQLIRMQPPGIYARLTADEAFMAKHGRAGPPGSSPVGPPSPAGARFRAAPASHLPTTAGRRQSEQPQPCPEPVTDPEETA